MARSLLIKYIKIINLEAIFYGPSHTNRRDNHIHTHEESGILDLDKTHLTHVRAQSTVVSTSMIIRLNSYFVNIRNFFKKIIALTFCQSNFKERKTVFFIFFHMPTFSLALRLYRAQASDASQNIHIFGNGHGLQDDCPKTKFSIHLKKKNV